MNTLNFLKEFLQKGEISHRWASRPNRASLLPYEQPLRIILYRFFFQINKLMACPNLLFSRTVVILRILIIIFNILPSTYFNSFKINIKQIIFGYSKIQCGIQTLILGCKIKQARRTESEDTSKSTTAYPTRLFQSLTIFLTNHLLHFFSLFLSL